MRQRLCALAGGLLLAFGVTPAARAADPPVVAGAANPELVASSDQAPQPPENLDVVTSALLRLQCPGLGLPPGFSLPHSHGAVITKNVASKKVKVPTFANGLTSAVSMTLKGKGRKATATLKAKGKDVEKLKVMAFALAAGGSPRGALAALLLAQKKAPKDATVLISASALLTNLGHPEIALAFLDKAKVLKGKRPSLLRFSSAAVEQNNRGQALLKVNRLPEAVRQLRKAAAAAPTLREASQNLGLALICEGHNAEGAKYLRAGRSRTNHAMVSTPTGFSRPLAEDVFDLSGGTPGVLPVVNYPSTPDRAPGLVGPLRADQAASSARSSASVDAGNALTLTLNGQLAGLTPLTRDRITSVSTFLGTASSEPSIAAREAAMNAAEPKGFEITFGQKLQKISQDCGGSPNEDACVHDACVPMTSALNGQWLGAMNFYDTKVRDYWTALHQYRTGLIANVTQTTAHADFMEDTKQLGELALRSLVTPAAVWAGLLDLYKVPCVPGYEPPPAEVPASVATDPGGCPPGLKDGQSYSLATPIGSVGVNCDELSLGVASEGLIGLFGKTSTNGTSTTAVVGVRGGAFGADWESGFYVRTGPSGVEDVGWRTGPSVSVGAGGVSMDAGLSQVDISLVGAIGNIPTALGG